MLSNILGFLEKKIKYVAQMLNNFNIKHYQNKT